MATWKERKADVWAEYRAGRITMNDLLAFYQPLIRHEVRKVASIPGFSREELWAEGTLACWNCIQNFDAARDVQFETYFSKQVAFRIKDMLRTLGNKRRSVRGGRNATFESFGSRHLYLRSHADDPSDQIIEKEEFDRVTASCSPNEKRLLRMRFIDDFSVAEIAREVGIPEANMYYKFRLIFETIREKHKPRECREAI